MRGGGGIRAKKKRLGCVGGKLFFKAVLCPFLWANIGAEAGAKDRKELGFKALFVIDSYRCSPFSATEWYFAFEDAMPKGGESWKER